MTGIVIVIIIALGAFACATFGMPAYSVIMALLACFLAGLVSAIIAMLVGTNVFKMNYETAFTRGFQGGIALVATIVVVGTAVLNLLAGGITTGVVEHLWQVSLNCAVAVGGVAVLTAGTWAYLVFGRRQPKQ